MTVAIRRNTGHDKIAITFNPSILHSKDEVDIMGAAHDLATIIHEKLPRCAYRTESIRLIDQAVLMALAALKRRGTCYG